jgi:gluconate kinase
MRLTDGIQPGNPFGRTLSEKAHWHQRARKALDNWAPNTETSVAAALEESYRDGLRRAARFIDEKGQRELAAMVRKLAEERQ